MTRRTSRKPAAPKETTWFCSTLDNCVGRHDNARVVNPIPGKLAHFTKAVSAMMRFRRLSPMFACLLLAIATTAWSQELRFRHHFIDQTLPQNDRLQGDYGLTALVDINHDGHLDFVLGGRQSGPERLYWYEFQAVDKWVRHEIGTGYQSDVGLAALDVDGDGWIDLVCSGVWYRNPGNPATRGNGNALSSRKTRPGRMTS